MQDNQPPAVAHNRTVLDDLSECFRLHPHAQARAFFIRVVSQSSSLTPLRLPSSPLGPSQSISETVGGDNGPASASSSAPRRGTKSSGNRKTWERAGSGPADEMEEAPGETRRGNSGGGSTPPERGGVEPNTSRSNQQPDSPPRQTAATPDSGAGDANLSSTMEADSRAFSPVRPSVGLRRYLCDSTPQDRGGEAAVGSGGLPKPRSVPPTRPSRGVRSALSDTTSAGLSDRRRTTGSGAKKPVLDRRRITTTPVWKRPAVPLSKPYVPVPRTDSGRL